MLNQTLAHISLLVIGYALASPSYADTAIKTLNPMLESYINSPLQTVRLRCDFATLVEHSGKANNLEMAARGLVKCMPAQLENSLRGLTVSMTGSKSITRLDMDDVASQLCDVRSPLHTYYETALPEFADIAVNDGWKKADYLGEMTEEYGLFCSQYYEGLLSDIATVYGLRSVVTGTSELAKNLDPRGTRTYRELSQAVLSCSISIIKGSDKGTSCTMMK